MVFLEPISVQVHLLLFFFLILVTGIAYNILSGFKLMPCTMVQVSSVLSNIPCLLTQDSICCLPQLVTYETLVHPGHTTFSHPSQPSGSIIPVTWFPNCIKSMCFRPVTKMCVTTLSVRYFAHLTMKLHSIF